MTGCKNNGKGFIYKYEEIFDIFGFAHDCRRDRLLCNEKAE